MSETWESLGSIEIATTAGFAVGAADDLLDKSTLERPLLNLFVASISGGLCAIGASIVHILVPPVAKPLIPIICIMSIGRRVIYGKRTLASLNISTTII